MTAALSLEGAAGLALATAVFAAIPGPGVTAVVSQSLARGLKASLLWGFGIILGDAFYLLLAMFGLSVAAQQLGWVFTALKWAGAGYLIYLGLVSLGLRSLFARGAEAAAPSAEASAQPGARSLARTFLAGFCVSLGNPKVVAFYCGFLPGFVDMRALSGLDMLLVAAIILPTCYSVLAAYAWLASRGRSALGRGQGAGQDAGQGTGWKWMRRGAGAVMIGAGVAVAAD